MTADATNGEMSPNEMLDALGAALGTQYTVDRVLGQGGMGAVYLGRDLTLDRPVAIKVINPDMAANATLRERFMQEARAVAKLRHPNIVSVYAAGDSNGLLYFAMEFVPGESLRDVLKRDRRVDGPRAERIVREIALALDHAHGHGLVHRDVKPENILIDKDSGRAMLTDFGVSRAFEKDGGLTQTGMILGSPRYMSPEQASGDRAIDGRSDLYALALVAYEMYSGAPVVQSATAAGMLVKHLTETPAPLASAATNIPAHVAAAIDHGLLKDPDQRWQTGKAFAEAVAGETLTPSGDSATGRSRNATVRTKRIPIALIAAIAILLGGGAWWKLRGTATGTAYLVTPFEIQSGDASVSWLREGSVNMLTLTLGQWSDLNVVDYERTLSMLDAEGLSERARISLDDAMKLARRASAGTIVTGQVQTTRDSLLVVAKLYDARTGKAQSTAQEGAALGSDPRPVFERIAQKLLQIAGGPASGVALTQATTSSLEAYRAYLEGVKLLNSWKLVEADSAFARAIGFDSTFALAYHKRSLGIGWGDFNTVDNPANRAFALASRLPPRERSLVEGHYHLMRALAATNTGDTTVAHAEFAASIKAYDDLFARGDTLVAEAWHGRADSYHHRRSNNSSVADLKAWTEQSFRGFSKTLAIDSTYHLAYAHIVELLNQAATNSGILISGDSAIVLDDAAVARLKPAGITRLREEARARGIEIARAWARADDGSVRPFLQLATSYAAANKPDSAIATLREALVKPRSGGPGAQLALLSVQSVFADSGASNTLKYILDRFTVDSLKQVVVNQRFGAEGDMLSVAAAAGSSANVDRAAKLFLAADPVLPTTSVSTAPIVALYATALRVAMGEPLDENTRSVMLRTMTAMDTMPGLVGQQVRSGSVSVPYLAFLATRDARFRDPIKKWSPPGEHTELDALTLLEKGDTAAAMKIAKTFPPPDSLIKARFGMGGMRTVARAEVLERLGLTRQAAETYAAIKPERVNRTGLAEPGYAVLVRTALARARLWKQLGERDRAIGAYEEFIQRWKDADGVAAKQVSDARRELADMKDTARKD